MTMLARDTIGDALRNWRQRRRLSQLDLALETGVSARHISFIENGRSLPSRGMLLRLAESLALPLRERNRLLLAAGFAPHFPERPLDAPDMEPAMTAVRAVLAAFEPYPALAVDRHWTLVEANQALSSLTAGVASYLLEPPVNVLRLSLAPDGLAPMILNLEEWRHHVLERLRRDAATFGDPALERLRDDLTRLAPAASPSGTAPQVSVDARVAVPLVLRHPVTGQRLSFLSTTTIFGTANDVSLAELTLEGFLPADEETREALAAVA